MKYSIAACAALALAWGIAARAGEALSDCRGIAADSARLACYDALVDGRAPAGTTTAPDHSLPAPSATVATAATAATAVSPAPAATLPSPEELFGRDVAASDEIVRRASGVGQLDEITATIDELQVAPYGKLVLALDNGQVWSQVDSARVDLRNGDKVRIRRASLGSFLLSANGRKQSIRVRRSK